MSYRFMSGVASISRAFVVSMVLVAPLQAAELPALLDQARQLMTDNQAAEAVSLLSAEELAFGGDTEFDYWLGLASIRAGQPARAVFPLERVLAQEPNHAGARMELASAYIQLGQKDAARRELEKLESMDPPEAAAERIAAMNKAVDRQERAEQRKDRVIYITAELGEDDNVGTWPDTRIDILPGSPTIEPIDSSFKAVQAGYWQRFAVNGTNALALSLNGLKRVNNDDNDVDEDGDGLPDDGDARADQFDQDYLSARVEWIHDFDGRHALATGIDVAGMDLDDERYYRFRGIYTEWRNSISQTRNYRVRLGARRIDFEEDQYDYTQSQLLTGVVYVLADRWRLGVDVNLDYEAANRDRPGGDASVYGLRTNLAHQLAARHRLTLTGYLNKADYKRPYEAFTAFNVAPEDRDDTRFGGGLVYEYFMTDALHLRGRVEYRDQSSSLDAYDFDQTIGSLALSYYL